jgi:oligosaccharide 4-alpha-D-glucosyltransferase
MKFKLLAIYVLCCCSAYAQNIKQLKAYDRKELLNQTLKIYAEKGLLALTVYQANMIKVSYYQDENQKPDSSYVVISEPKETKFKVSQNLDDIFLTTDSLIVIVNKLNFSIKFLKSNEQPLCINTKASELVDSIKQLNFTLHSNEAIYGLGSRAIPLNRNGYRLENYHQPHYNYAYGEENLNLSVPFFSSDKGYGIYFDNKGAGYFDIGKTDKTQFQYSSQSGDLSYYFIAGSPNQLLKSYTWLTGRQPLPPIWALGFIQSRFGYKSQKEALEIVKKTKSAGYPIDATVLDLFWYGDVKSIGNLDWRRDSFPQPKKMLQELKALGVKTIPITQTFITKLSDNFKTATQQNLFTKGIDGKDYILNGFWAGPAGLLDIFKPEAQQYLWKFYKQRINEGVAGWWSDLGEPEQHPDSMRHMIGNARDVHSIYPLVWSQLIYDNYRKDFPEQRVFNLARSGGAGMQRYSTFPWSGDVNRSWEGLKAQIPIMLGAGLSGIGYMHADAGGFAQGEKDPELYTRWLQFASFTPIFRVHADPLQAAPEPIFWPDSTQNIVKKYIKLRYNLLPYNYTLAVENYNSGRPLAMPLNYFEKSDTLNNINDEYLWGSDLLVAPILKKGLTGRNVVFPEGKWMDFKTGKVYQNKAFINVALSDLAIFAKAGSFIPMATDMPNTEAYTSDTLHVKYFLASDTLVHQSKLFYDDGKDPLSIQNGKYEVLNFKGYSSKNLQIIEISSTKIGKQRDFFFEIYQTNRPKKIYNLNGNVFRIKGNIKQLQKENTAYYDPKNKTLQFHIKSNVTPIKVYF